MSSHHRSHSYRSKKSSGDDHKENNVEMVNPYEWILHDGCTGVRRSKNHLTINWKESDRCLGNSCESPTIVMKGMISQRGSHIHML